MDASSSSFDSETLQIQKVYLSENLDVKQDRINQMLLSNIQSINDQYWQNENPSLEKPEEERSNFCRLLKAMRPWERIVFGEEESDSEGTLSQDSFSSSSDSQRSRKEEMLKHVIKEQTLGGLLLPAFSEISVNALKVLLKNPTRGGRDDVLPQRFDNRERNVRMEYLASLSGIYICLQAQPMTVEPDHSNAGDLDIDFSDIKFDDVTPTKSLEKEIYSQVTQSTSGTGFKKLTEEKPVSEKARTTPKRALCLRYSAQDPSERLIQSGPFSPAQSGLQGHFIPTFNRKPLHVDLKAILGRNLDQSSKCWSQVSCNDIDIQQSWLSVMYQAHKCSGTVSDDTSAQDLLTNTIAYYKIVKSHGIHKLELIGFLQEPHSHERCAHFWHHPCPLESK